MSATAGTSLPEPPPEPVPEPLQEAKRAAAQHRFGDARSLLQTYLRAHPRDGSAWLQLASVATVSGHIRLGREACERAAPWMDPLATLACRGRLALFAGDYRAALAPLEALLAHPRYRHRDGELVHWAYGVAAELAVAVGDVAAADRYFARALAGGAAQQLRAAWLDHLLATARPRAVIAATDTWRSPTALQLRRLIALRRLGELSREQDQVDYLDWLFQSDMQRGQYLHGREIARFYLDVLPRPALAQRAASRNLEHQREAEDFALYRRSRVRGE